MDATLEKEELTIESVSIENQQKNNEEKPKFRWTKDRIFLAIMFTLIVIVTVVLFVMVLIDDTILFDIITNYFLKPIYQLRLIYQILIFFGFMILQSIIAPIPSELILTTGGILFGWWGIPIGVVGSMLSAILSYYVSKRGGRSIIDASGNKLKIVDRTILVFDEWIKRWGLWAIIICRAVPFIAFDNVSYAAGLAKIKDSHYLIATFLGSIPRATFYSFMGISLLGDNTIQELINNPALIEQTASRFNTIFFIILGIMIIAFITSNVISYFYERKKKRQLLIEQQDTI